MVSLRAEGKSDRVGRRDGMVAFRDQAFTARSNRCGVPGTGSLLVGDRKGDVGGLNIESGTRQKSSSTKLCQAGLRLVGSGGSRSQPNHARHEGLRSP